MSDTGLPPDLPGEAKPNYGAQPYRQPQTPAPQTAQPAAPPPPTYAAPPPYTPPVYPPAKSGMSTGAKIGLFSGIGCLVLIIVPVIAIALVGLGSSFSSLGDDEYDPWIPTDDGVTSSGNGVGAVESQWKSGQDWLTAPVGETPPNDFAPGYPTAGEWLQYNMGAGYDFDVVFTSDPAYNCGMAKAEPKPDWVIGCYNPDYGRTVFIWWGPDAAVDMKELILLHEYSHFWQNWENFDATRSADDAGLFDDPQFVQEVWETDATCRVYVDWHYTTLRYLDSLTVSPCGDTGWGEHWFENELLERGVRITDY
jgi:hypothetical protein